MSEILLEKLGDFAIFKFEEPVKQAVRIKNFSIDSEGETARFEFRWSYDDSTYSAWVELTPENLQNVVCDPEKNLFFEFRAILIENGPVKIKNIFLDIEFAVEDPYGNFQNNISCCECGNLEGVTKLENFCFKPYDVNPAICLYNELSYMVNEIFGHETLYFKAVPDKKGTDVILGEHTLYNVEPGKKLKVLVENNEFPDSKLTYNPFGIDFEQPFEIHVDKRYFEEVFGKGAAPQKEDIIYFPINNRLYEVLSSYLFKAFMEKDSYWKISLIKYQPKSKRYEPEEVRNLIDELSTDTSELFETEFREQETKLTKPQQYNRFIGDKDYDPVRKTVRQGLRVIEKQIRNYSIVIAEYVYKSNNLVDYTTPLQKPVVEYKEPARFLKEEDRSYCAWFSKEKPAFFVPVDAVLNTAFDASTCIITIEISAKRNYIPGDYLKLSRPGGITFYGIVKQQISQNIFNLEIPAPVVEYLENYNSLWSGLSNYKAEKIIPENLLHAFDEKTGQGFSFDLLAERYIRLKFNDKEFIFPLDADIVPGNWYGIFINASNVFKQLSVFLWERKWKESDGMPQTTNLFNIYNKTLNNVKILENSIDLPEIPHALLASNLEITNIRLFDRTVEEEKQPVVLNQNIVQDAQYGIIIDNALPVLKVPFIAKTK